MARRSVRDLTTRGTTVELVLLGALSVLVCALPASASNIINIEGLNGVDGFVVQGPDGIGFGDHLGSVGDINGDGLDELGFGAPDLGPQGGVYVLFGAETFPSTVSFQSPDGSDGFVLVGEVAAGFSLAAAGDLNADGIDDFITGAPGLNDGRGRAYIVYGHGPPFPATANLADLMDGVSGTRITYGPLTYKDNNLGRSLASLGDANGDGIDDVVVGAIEAAHPTALNKYGAAYVIFGRAGGLGAELCVSDLDGTNGFAFYGITANATGMSVAGGDVNGDGLGDVVTGAPGVTGLVGDWGGYSYVIFGRDDPFPSWFDASALDGSNGFTVIGPPGGIYDPQLGRAVAASDLNGDGRAEAVLGAPNVYDPVDDDLTGAAYVIWGKSGGYPASIEAANLDGNDGFAFYGYIADYGQNGAIGVNAAGGFDFNADGREDLAFGNRDLSVGAQRTGEGYIVFGRAGGYSGPYQWLEELDEMTGHFVRCAGLMCFLGEQVAAFGDVNGDGRDDIAFTAMGYPNTAFVLLGNRGRVVFWDDFESGSTDQWCSSSP